jgi:Tfp pilus assembly protein PilF
MAEGRTVYLISPGTRLLAVEQNAMNRGNMLVWMTVLICGATGCSQLTRQPQIDYRTVDADANHDTEAARRKNARALKILEHPHNGGLGHIGRAEKTLQEALAADVTYGPAHNNLGKVYFRQQKYYLAAWEFEYAMKLMPHRSEPMNNLGMVYEEVGKFDKAMEMYAIAYSIDPQNPEIIGNLARCSMRQGDSVDQVKPLLEDLVMLDYRPEWVNWAREQLVFSQVKEASDTDPLLLEPGAGRPSEEGPEVLPRPSELQEGMELDPYSQTRLGADFQPPSANLRRLPPTTGRPGGLSAQGLPWPDSDRPGSDSVMSPLVFPYSP